jgi:hypothetical protein
MFSSKKIYLYRDFAAGVYLSEAPSPPLTPYSFPFYSLYTCILYNNSHRKGGGEANQREG